MLTNPNFRTLHSVSVIGLLVAVIFFAVIGIFIALIQSWTSDQAQAVDICNKSYRVPQHISQTHHKRHDKRQNPLHYAHAQKLLPILNTQASKQTEQTRVSMLYNA